MTAACFTKASVAKRAVQLNLYQYLGRSDHRSILVLAGRCPGFEIACARSFLPHAKITAVDRDTKAIEAARAAGVDEVLQVDLDSDQLEARQFDIVNLDLCSNVLDGAAKYATRARHFFVVFGSAGRNRIPATVSVPRLSPVLAPAIDRRARRLWSQVAAISDLVPVRVYSYSSDGASMRMFGVVFGRAGDARWDPFCVKVSPWNLRRTDSSLTTRKTALR